MSDYLTRYMIFFGAAIAAFSGCDSERYPQEIPLLKTETVTDVSQEGAIFNGSVISLGVNQKVIEYGFVLSTLAGEKDLSSRVQVLDPISEGRFSLNARSHLRLGKKYFVRAYLKTDKVVVFGNEVSFSVDLEPPLISEIIPKTGFDGDIITIRGKNFAIMTEDNLVSIAGASALIIESSATEIKVQIPATDKFGNVPIRVETNKKTVELAGSFSIDGPSISSVTPSSSPVGFIIEITGDNLFFPKDYINTNVTFGETTERYSDAFAIVSSSSKNKLRVFVPNYYPFLPSSPPSIDTFIKVTVYSYVNSRRGSKVAKANFKFLNSWQKLGSTPPLLTESYLNSISYGGKGYIIGSSPTKGYAVAELWEYDPSTDIWKQKADFLGGARPFSTLTAVGNKLFYGMGTKNFGGSNFETDIWAYDINSDSWSLATNFPGVPRLECLSFSTLDKIFVGFGDRLDMWAYDLSTQLWTRQDIGKFGTVNPRTVSALQTQGRYFLMTSNNIFELDIASNIWEAKPDLMPEPFNYNSDLRFSNSNLCSFVWDGSAVSRFTPNSFPYWQRLQDFSGEGIPFAIDGRLFIGQWKLQVP